MTTKPPRPEIVAFLKETKRYKRNGRRVPWAQRAERIRETYPSVELDGETLLARDDVFLGLLKSIYTIGEVSGTTKLPELTWDEAMRVHRNLAGETFTELPFQEAFAKLAEGRGNSMAGVAAKTGLPKTKVFRLMRGEERPALEDMVVIAAAYNKPPEYFVEYRVEYIASSVAAQLQQMAPETTIGLYRKVRGYGF